MMQFWFTRDTIVIGQDDMPHEGFNHHEKLVPLLVEKNKPPLDTQKLYRFGKVHHKPKKHGFLVTQYGDILVINYDNPKTYEDDILDPNFSKLLEAIKFKMDSMY